MVRNVTYYSNESNMDGIRMERICILNFILTDRDFLHRADKLHRTLRID